MSVPSYRLTEADLVDADKRTVRGVAPLLDALNMSLKPAVDTLNGLATPLAKASSFTTVATGAAYVDLGLGAPATDVWVTGLAPSDGSVLDSVWSMSWVPLTAGARLLFVGLAALTTYNLRVRWL